MSNLNAECRPVCPIQRCLTPFDRVVVSYLIAGGTRVQWDLVPTYVDPGPLIFQLQVGTTANPEADDWTDVGLPMTDAYYAIDGEKRVYGKVNWTHYRVRLDSSAGTYYSDPVNLWGTLGPADWRYARAIARRELLHHRGASQRGYLLKRRVTGLPCQHCLDSMTDEVRNPSCRFCYATGFECGYYYPMGCVWMCMTPRSRRIELDAGQARGTVNDIVIKAERCVLTELMGEDDVWISEKTDDRYFIHRVDHIAEIRGAAVLGDVELRPIPYSSIIYDLGIPAQLLLGTL